MKVQVILFIQYYNINLLFLKSLLVKGSSYFPLPQELKSLMKELINIQEEDNECFRWCLVRY